jgi:hypothetical protein
MTNTTPFRFGRTATAVGLGNATLVVVPVLAAFLAALYESFAWQRDFGSKDPRNLWDLSYQPLKA